MVLQGGGALGAYQVGVYEALHEAGIEPDWVIGTSIGAINGALIAANRPQQRLERLNAFWQRIEHDPRGLLPSLCFPFLGNAAMNWLTLVAGIPAFFIPNPMALLGQHAQIGVENAAYYLTSPLRDTLAALLDLDYLNARHTRLSLGAVKVCSGEMHYFDSRSEPITLAHVMASGALPPAFPAVCIDGEFYWDGGIYSNTPIEAVLDDHPRRDSLIFSVDVWKPDGPAPDTLWQVAGREKDIKYASRANSHMARQKQIHHLRHVILKLANAMPERLRNSAEIKELASWGCQTTMHVVRLVASGLDGEDQLKDIDFTPASIRARRKAGYEDTRRMLDLSPWNRPVDPIEGVIIHDMLAAAPSMLGKGVDGFAGRTK
ncbi:patatin-like phospholipase family protein [Herbaspirillum sp. ST 5-3]|uniref:patatin-like phospholipase family protein n=1 Tax=Oxalobacteraceae TaxID=75682 RepID=UPI0010A2DA78|nr:patatin-like phospholipase family protein [Herbaspirillum sp. ST 5-3]